MNIENIVREIYSTLRADELPVSELSEDVVNTVVREIAESVFLAQEGKKLALNILHYIYPDSCRVAAAGDFVGEAQEEVLNAINDLPNNNLLVTHISSDGGCDWESLYDDEDGIYGDEEKLEKNFTLNISFRVNSFREKVTLKLDEAPGPDPFFDKIAPILSEKHEEFRKNILKTYTIWDVFDMDGAILICSLPGSTMSKIRDIIGDIS